MNYFKRVVAGVMLLACPVVFQAQTVGQSRVDLFVGADFHYRDIFYNKVYEVLLNLTPGVKWNMGRQWQVAGRAMVPLPVGTALKLSGSQAVENVSISSGSRSVSGKRYGSVSIAASTYNRQHSGGSN